MGIGRQSHVISSLLEDKRVDLNSGTARSHVIPTLPKLLAALHFLALSLLIYSREVTIIHYCCDGRVLKARPRWQGQHICFLQTADRINSAELDFFFIAGCPNFSRAIDGTHRPIKTPSEDHHVFKNRFFFFFLQYSMNILVGCSAECLITNVVPNFNPGFILS